MVPRGSIRSPSSSNPVENLCRPEREVLDLLAALNLVPRHRRRHGWRVEPAQGVRRDGRLRGVVLAPVEEHLAGPDRLRHRRHHEVGAFAGEPLGEFLGVRRRGLAARLLDRDVELHALRPGGLRPRLEPVGVEEVAQQEGDLAARHEVGRRAGIEVDDEQVGLADPAARTDLPLGDVQLEGGEVGQPDEGGEPVDDDVLDLLGAAGASRRGDLDRTHPRGVPRGAFFSKKGCLWTPFGPALAGQRAVGETREEYGGDPRVVVDDLALGEARVREEHLVEVGQLQDVAVDLDAYGGGLAGCHGRHPCPGEGCAARDAADPAGRAVCTGVGATGPSRHEAARAARPVRLRGDDHGQDHPAGRTATVISLPLVDCSVTTSFTP